MITQNRVRVDASANSWIEFADASQLDHKDNARQHEESQRHRAVESLHPVFQFTQSVSLDLAAIAGIRAGGFARAGQRFRNEDC
jgi:hypothetical protein